MENFEQAEGIKVYISIHTFPCRHPPGSPVAVPNWGRGPGSSGARCVPSAAELAEQDPQHLWGQALPARACGHTGWLLPRSAVPAEPGELAVHKCNFVEIINLGGFVLTHPDLMLLSYILSYLQTE